MSDLYALILRPPTIAAVRTSHVAGIAFGFSQFAQFSVFALAFWYGGQLISNGEMNFEEVFKVWAGMFTVFGGGALGGNRAALQASNKPPRCTLQRCPRTLAWSVARACMQILVPVCRILRDCRPYDTCTCACRYSL
jgi:hypothetical protein